MTASKSKLLTTVSFETIVFIHTTITKTQISIISIINILLLTPEPAQAASTKVFLLFLVLFHGFLFEFLTKIPNGPSGSNIVQKCIRRSFGYLSVLKWGKTIFNTNMSLALDLCS